MNCQATHNMCAIRGDTFAKTITLRQFNPSTGQHEPIDLTGATIAFHIGADRNAAPLYTYDAPPEITMPDPTTGSIRIRVNKPETQTWPVRTYAYDVRVTWDDGTVTTVLNGSFAVRNTVGP